MATPIRYKVTMNRMFVLNDNVYGPAQVEGPKKGFPRYFLPADMYENGKLDDGTPIKDCCATADPEYAP